MKLLILLLAAALTFRETELIPLEPHYYDSDMLDTHCALYRLGEVVTINGQLAVIWNYHFDGREWRYTVRPAHYYEKNKLTPASPFPKIQMSLGRAKQ